MIRFFRSSAAVVLSGALIVCSLGIEAQCAAARSLPGRTVSLPASLAASVVPLFSNPAAPRHATLLASQGVPAMFSPAFVAAPRAVSARLSEKLSAISSPLAAIADSNSTGENRHSALEQIDAVLSGQAHVAEDGTPAPVFEVGPVSPSALGLTPAPQPRASPALTQTTFVVFDLETTGFNPEVNQIIQVGAVKMRLQDDGSIKVIDTFEQLVDPKVPVPAAITELTGITNGDLKGQPTLKEILPAFASFVAQDAVLVAHNAPFDAAFLGYQMKELGVPAMPHLIIDTKDIARSIFPGLKSYKVKDLIHELGIGEVEAHRGLSDSLQEAAILAKAVVKLAADRKTTVSELSFEDVLAHSSRLSLTSILDALKPKYLPAPSKPIPADSSAEVDRISKELHERLQPSMLRDVAFKMGVDYEWLRDALRQEALRAQVASADEILADLEKNPPSAIITDYNNTLTDRGSDGLSLPTPEDLLAEIETALASGLPVVLASALNYDYQPPEAVKPDSPGIIPYELYSTLVSRIRPSLRGNLFVTASLGGEIVLFDSQSGEAIPYVKTPWDPGEKELLLKAVETTLSDLNIAKSELTIMDSNPNQIGVIFKVADAAKATEFGARLIERFKDHNILLPVLQNRNWVYFSKFKKSDATRLAYSILKAKGYPVSADSLLFLGDEFRTSKDGTIGGDALMSMPFPKSRAISVGDTPGDRLPPNARRLGIREARGSLRVFQAINKGRAAQGLAAEGVPWLRHPLAKTAGLFLAGAASALLLRFVGPLVGFFSKRKPFSS